MKKSLFSVATLAVGTEVTEGQIIDRNSAFISQQLVNLGFSIGEHRAVPDDRPAILSALQILAKEYSLLFVFGGLGPTSDDFTREIISEAAGTPLVFSDSAWAHVEQTLSSRGVSLTAAQKQQCYFPKGATTYKNNVGTALTFSVQIGDCLVFALPGPPAEVADVWKNEIQNVLQNKVPEDQRTHLKIWRLLGKGESFFAEITERVMKDSGLTLGYRAHQPYVEVKVWVPAESRLSKDQLEKLRSLDAELSPWLVNRDNEDLLRDVVKLVGEQELRLTIYDRATLGLFSERVAIHAREALSANLPIRIISDYGLGLESGGSLTKFPVGESEIGLELRAFPGQNRWRLAIHQRGVETAQELIPLFNYKIGSERARRYLTEFSLRRLLHHLTGIRIA